MAQYKIKQCIKATWANRQGTGRLRTADLTGTGNRSEEVIK